MQPRLVQLTAVIVCAGLMYGASRFMPSINQGREQMNMIGSDAALQPPPEYAFLIQAFGAFRSLITDIAFIRAEEFKQKGRFYDAMSLHKWICHLQPRFPSVWEYCAWNMAWNISVTTYTHEERWNWVYNGVKLLRDQGLLYNDRAINLYRQLAWTFNNKMSETIDEYHMTYKCNWAWRMHLLFGPPPDPLGQIDPLAGFETVKESLEDPLYAAAKIEQRRVREKLRKRAAERGEKLPEYLLKEGEEGAVPAVGEAPPEEEEGRRARPRDVLVKAAYDRIKGIADAPDTLSELYAQTPESQEMVAKLRELGVMISDDTLTEDAYWSDAWPNEKLSCTFFGRWRALADPGALSTAIAASEGPEEKDAALTAFDRIVGVTEQRPAGQALYRFLQKKVLREVYKLDPAHMAYLVQEFGPMDWRSVDAHSLYWITLGIIKGGETVNKFGNDKTNASRIIFFSLRNLYLRNRIVFEPYPKEIHNSYISLTPDLNFVESMHKAYLTYGPNIDPDPGRSGEKGAGDTYKAGHQNFLGESIRLLYLSDRKEEAAHYYRYLRTTYGLQGDGRINPYYDKPLHEFVMDSFYEGIEGPRETTVAIASLLDWAFTELAEGDVQRYANLVYKAYDLHKTFTEEKKNVVTASIPLPPFFDIQVDTLANWLMRPSLSRASTVHKARLWRVAPPELRQNVYDMLLPTLRRECEVYGFDLAKAFPEPPGMEHFRAQRQKERRGPERQENPNVITPPRQGG